MGNDANALEEAVAKKAVKRTGGDQEKARSASGDQEKARSASSCDSVVPDNTLHLKLLPELPESQASEGGRCLDGSQAGYYYGPPNCGESGTWVFYMNGGGGCSDVPDCTNWMNKSAGGGQTQAPKGSSGWENGVHGPRYWKETAQGKDFLSSHPDLNPDFHHAHHVRIPYCTGDSHAGTAIQEGLYLTGHSNFVRMIHHIAETIEAWSSATHILLWGVSAGGKGVLVNCDWLRREVEDMGLSATVKCAPHSSMFLPAYWADEGSEPEPALPPLNYELWKVGGERPAVPQTDFYHSYIPPECEDDEYCRSGGNIYRYIQTPVYAIQDEYDTAPLQQLGFAWQTEESETVEGQKYISLFGASVRETLKNHKSGDGVYLTSCFQHGSHTANVNSGEVSYQDSLGDWFWGRGNVSHVLMDDCSEVTGLPCNPNCANLDASTCLLEFSTRCQEQLGSKKECKDCAKAWADELTAAGCTEDELVSIIMDTC